MHEDVAARCPNAMIPRMLSAAVHREINKKDDGDRERGRVKREKECERIATEREKTEVKGGTGERRSERRIVGMWVRREQSKGGSEAVTDSGREKASESVRREGAEKKEILTGRNRETDYRFLARILPHPHLPAHLILLSGWVQVAKT